MPERYVLDTSAIFTFTDQEVGATVVDQILQAAAEGRCGVGICSASLMEIYYITLQEEGEIQAAGVLGLIKSWPIHWLWPDEKTLLLAGRLKAYHRISFADAQIAASAIRSDATLVHKDPEFEDLAGRIKLLSLPFKSHQPPKPSAEPLPTG